MRILLVADEESPYLWDYYKPGRLDGIDLILSCGDLKQEYLEFLVTMSGCSLYYVHGNHDKGYVNFPPEGCECLEDALVNFNGLRIAGLGGCARYNPGPYQYTEAEMDRRVRKLDKKIRKAGGVDILIAHAPPKGIGDAPDNAHRGFPAFVDLIERWHPRFLIHGHVHPSYGSNQPRQIRHGDTMVFNCVGWHLLEIEPIVPPEEKKKGFLDRLRRK